MSLIYVEQIEPMALVLHKVSSVDETSSRGNGLVGSIIDTVFLRPHRCSALHN